MVSKLRAVERESASMQVVNSIKEAIQSGELKTGDKLPNEAMLSEVLNVGRSSLREGMQILAAYGVVEIKQGDGTYVANKFAEHVFEFMGIQPTKENIKNTIQLRQILETGCAELAYNKLTDEELAEMRTLAEKIRSDVTLEEKIEADKSFHDMLINASGNVILIEVYRMMRNMLDVLMTDLMRRDDVAMAARKSHLEIIAALERRDVNMLRTAINEHMDNIAKYYG